MIPVAVATIDLVRGQEYDGLKEQIERVGEEIDRYDKELENPNLSEEGRNSILSRLESAYAEATHWAHGRMVATMKAAGKITQIPYESLVIPTEGPPTYWKPPDGISDSSEEHLPIFGYDTTTEILSSWRKTTSDTYYLIFSGYLVDDPKQGMILKLPRDALSFSGFVQYLTPKKSGGVRIVEEHGLYIVLQADNGDLFYFDAVGERFIDSLDTPTVTAVPIEELESTRAATPSPIPYP